MSSVTEQQLRRRALTLFAILFGVLLYGAVGYRLLSGGKASWVDCLYMTTITVTTIGFGEVLPGSDGSGFRLFTLTLAFLGVGIFTYTVSSITFFATDEGLRARWRKRRMEKSLQNWNGHYLIGGWSAIAERIAGELRKTGRRVLTIAPARGACAGEPEELVLEGDPSDDEALRRAGIERAAGFFAASGDDSANIVSCLTARQLQPGIRIVAALVDPRNEGKMRRAGADAVISAPTIGALRMASEMVRPTVVSFLDIILRGSDPVLRIEEVTPAPRFAGQPLDAILPAGPDQALLVALKHGSDWVFNPPRARRLDQGETLIVMIAATELPALRDRLGDRAAGR